MKVIKNASMGEFTSFKVGGQAREMVIVESVDELKDILKEIYESSEKFIFLGNGSNTLFSDKFYDGRVIKLGEGFEYMEADDSKLVVGAAALMSKIARFAISKSLAGFEFASGIPGSIGGAVFMDAGAYGGEMSHIVESVKVVTRDGSEIKEIKGEDMDFGYRHSVLHETGDIAIEVTLKLEHGNLEDIEANFNDLTEKRTTKQPLEYPSCGSFFKRPEGYFAGKLIQDSGMRGASVGGAQVSEKHCGFLINKGDATATDVLALKKLVQDTVYEKFGVKLEPEVRIIGDE